MHPLIAAAVLLALSHGLCAAEPAGVRGAVQRSLAFLEKDGLAWKEKRQCASCHHVPMTLWSLHEARKQGYAVNDKALAELTAFVSAADNRAKIFPDPKQPPKQKLVNQASLMLSLALQAGDVKDKPMRDALDKAISVLLTGQGDDGTWKLGDGRLPMVAGAEVMTTLTVLALLPRGEENKDVKAAREKALKWLAAVPADEDLQATALRLLLRQRLGKPANELQALVKQLVSRQRADGGWSQIKEMESDVYATGQVLYALSAAGVGPEDAAVKKAQAFLVKTQKPDGSWPMTSRPMKPGGQGAKELSPITHIGAAWGTLGLMRSSAKGAGPVK